MCKKLISLKWNFGGAGVGDRALAWLLQTGGLASLLAAALAMLLATGGLPRLLATGGLPMLLAA